MKKSVAEIESRANSIVDLINRRKHMTVDEMVGHLNVSECTVRRQLAVLESEGRLVRTRGGAMSIGAMLKEEIIDAHHQANMAIKKRIAAAAYNLLARDASFFLGGGTTCLELAKLIVENQLNCVIVTPSIITAAELVKSRRVELWMPGGVVYNRTQYITGSDANRYLSGRFANIAFLGCDALSMERGVTTATAMEADIDKLMIKNAARVCIITDSSKLGKMSNTQICALDALDTLITDVSASEPFLAGLRNCGIEVITA